MIGKNERKGLIEDLKNKELAIEKLKTEKENIEKNLHLNDIQPQFAKASRLFNELSNYDVTFDDKEEAKEDPQEKVKLARVLSNASNICSEFMLLRHGTTGPSSM